MHLQRDVVLHAVEIHVHGLAVNYPHELRHVWTLALFQGRQLFDVYTSAGPNVVRLSSRTWVCRDVPKFFSQTRVLLCLARVHLPFKAGDWVKSVTLTN